MLSEDGDPLAPWLVDGLTARRLRPIHHLTTTELIETTTWVHTVGDDGARFRAQTGNGVDLPSDSIAGVINRIGFIAPTHAAGFVDADREYALAELNAFFMSWLSALDAPVLNPPSARGLAGAWRPASEWAHLAQRAGLTPRLVTSADPESIPFADTPHRTAFVVGGEIVDDGLDETTRQACLRLSDLSATPLLGVEFEMDDQSGLVLTGASPQPPIQLAGEAMLDALAHVLDRQAA